ncbi:MAG TPA: hypothetical protein DDY31_07850, partial [Lachnospiraceae bacterium]|nr:hypothetical protein [Lachnospiraceae bacterium]
MQKITREAIRQMASSETVYYRGMRYYAAHAVTKVTWNDSNKQYRSVVKGSNQYLVMIQLGEEEIVFTCNCPASVKYTGACKHVVATLLFIADYQQRQEISETHDPEEQTAYQIVEYFRKREYRRLIPQYYHVHLQITVPEFFKDHSAKAYLSISAGCTKMYKVSNTKKFIEDCYQENTIRLGKEFCFIPGECAFDAQSVPVIEYLTEIYEIQETLGKTYYSDLFNRQELVLSQRMLSKMLHIIAGTKCSLSLYGKPFTEVSVVAGNPEAVLKLTMENEKLYLQNDSENKLLSLCK